VVAATRAVLPGGSAARLVQFDHQVAPQDGSGDVDPRFERSVGAHGLEVLDMPAAGPVAETDAAVARREVPTFLVRPAPRCTRLLSRVSSQSAMEQPGRRCRR
jgi:hypothetical protein